MTYTPESDLPSPARTTLVCENSAMLLDECHTLIRSRRPRSQSEGVSSTSVGGEAANGKSNGKSNVTSSATAAAPSAPSAPAASAVKKHSIDSSSTGAALLFPSCSRESGAALSLTASTCSCFSTSSKETETLSHARPLPPVEEPQEAPREPEHEQSDQEKAHAHPPVETAVETAAQTQSTASPMSLAHFLVSELAKSGAPAAAADTEPASLPAAVVKCAAPTWAKYQYLVEFVKMQRRDNIDSDQNFGLLFQLMLESERALKAKQSAKEAKGKGKRKGVIVDDEDGGAMFMYDDAQSEQSDQGSSSEGGEADESEDAAIHMALLAIERDLSTTYMCRSQHCGLTFFSEKSRYEHELSTSHFSEKPHRDKVLQSRAGSSAPPPPGPLPAGFFKLYSERLRGHHHQSHPRLMTADAAAVLPYPPGSFICDICFDDLPHEQRKPSTSSCACVFCIPCLKAYAEQKVAVGVTKITCPGTNCSAVENDTTIRAVVSSETFERIEAFRAEALNDPFIKSCPRCHTLNTRTRKGEPTALYLASKSPSGSAAAASTSASDEAELESGVEELSAAATESSASSTDVDGISKLNYFQRRKQKKIAADERNEKVACCACAYAFCFGCQAPWHAGMTCKEFSAGDKLLEEWVGLVGARRCPRCKTRIARDSGCDHMHCSVCAKTQAQREKKLLGSILHQSDEWCYGCGDRYISVKFLGSHHTTFSIFGCKNRLFRNHPAARVATRATVLVVGSALAVPTAVGGVAAVAVGGLLYGTLVLPVKGAIKAYRKLRE